MSYLAEAHADWHAVYGRDAVCPLDCGVGEAEMDRLQDEYYSVCRSCHSPDRAPSNDPALCFDCAMIEAEPNGSWCDGTDNDGQPCPHC